MNINNNVGVKYNMEQTLLNEILKEIVREDKLDTLISMINNGLDIKDFSYNDFTGLNAMIAYCLDCHNEEGGSILRYLLETAKFNEIDPRNITRVYQYLSEELDEDSEMNIEDELHEISKLISDGAKVLFGLKDDEEIKPIKIGGISEFMDFLKSQEEHFNSKQAKEDEKTSSKSLDMPRVVSVDYGKPSTKTKSEIALETIKDKSSTGTSNKKIELKPAKDESSANVSNKKIELVQPIKEESTDNKSNSFTMIGESNYKVSSISSYVTFENTSTCESESIIIQAESIEDLNNKINEKISELNNQNDEKLINSVIEMMKNNSEFKNDLLKMMQEAQIKTC